MKNRIRFLHGRHNTTSTKMTKSEEVDALFVDWVKMYDRLAAGEARTKLAIDIDVWAAGEGWPKSYQNNLHVGLKTAVEHYARGGNRADFLCTLESLKADFVPRAGGLS